MNHRKFKSGDAVVFTDAAARLRPGHDNTAATYTVDRYSNSQGDLVLDNGEIWNQYWLEPAPTPCAEGSKT